MKRFLLTLAAAASLAAPLAVPTAAAAERQWERHGDRGGDRDGGRDHGRRGGGGEWNHDGRRGDNDSRWDGERRGGWDRDSNWDRGRHNGYWYNNRWFYGPPPQSYFGSPLYRPGYSSWRRGGYLPPYYNGWVVNDYYRYRLRRPPYGYHWVRIGGDYLLVSNRSNLIFDIIVGDARGY